MWHFIKRRRLVILLGAITLVVVLGMLWRSAITRNRSVPDEPFRIAGNLYYVGATGVTSFLLTGPEGHVLIDGGYPETAPLIIGSIAKLGFNIRDVKVLLNTHAHSDHAGGLRAPQEASGAQPWVSAKATPL
jgi:metallo-beta-lactamase class B